MGPQSAETVPTLGLQFLQITLTPDSLPFKGLNKEIRIWSPKKVGLFGSR